ncbi:hypothetical protein ACTMU2_39135 [Cupriavidus basilensis]
MMFGSKHASKQSYDFPVTIREVLPTLDDLAQMYSDGDVGLVFSTTSESDSVRDDGRGLRWSIWPAAITR